MRKYLIFATRVIMSLTLLFNPFIAHHITMQTNAVGAYYVTFYVVLCLSIAAFIFTLGFSVINFIEN